MRTFLSNSIIKVNLVNNSKALYLYLKERILRMRDVLYREGDSIDGIYFIKEGEVE